MIDEKKLIEEIEKFPFIHGRYDHKNGNIDFICGVETMYEMVMNKIKEQPKIGEWIPCSERLPEDRQKVIVSRNGETSENVFEFHIPDEEDYEGECGDTVMGYFFSEYDSVVGIYIDDTICTAWQPLPEACHE